MNYFEFIWDRKKIKFTSVTKKGLFIKIIDWLSGVGYNFSSDRLYSEVPIKSSYRIDHFYKIPGISKYIDVNFIKDFRGAINMLVDFGVNEVTIKFGTEKFGTENTDVKKYDVFESTKNSPFMQSICILGKSGRGKTVTVENILTSIPNMVYEFIIPTASTTNLLAQYSPASGRYIPSRLGKLIMKAHSDPGTLYTAVFDECHKSNLIEMINDELLQCISLYRNNRKRFISLDDETSSLYEGLSTHAGNLLIPDNFGFIFLSSKPDVIIQNSDFFNRVDIYVLVKQPRVPVTFDDTEYFVPVGDRRTGMKTLDDIDKIRDLNESE